MKSTDLKGQCKPERILKTIPDAAFKTNNPRDFFTFDYSLSHYLPETKDRIDEAINKLYTQIGKILEDDRAKAKEAGCI